MGVVTTARVTHATPAATYANTAERGWEAYVTDMEGDCKDIAHQLVINNPDIQVKQFDLSYKSTRSSIQQG